MNNVHLHTSASSRTSNSVKGSDTTSKPPAFQFISHDELLSLFEQRKGSQYFIPEGFEPVLIPRVLARSTAPTPPRGSVAKAQKPKKPPRPPNAFILYRRSKQPDIVAQNEGISNNEVSKQVGEMWHKEPLEEKMKFQRLADAAKMEHMKNPLMNSISTTNDDLSFLQQPQQIERRSSIESVSTIDYFDESRRSSMISCGDINDLNDIEYNEYIFDDVPSLDDQSQLQYSTTSSCNASNSHEFNVCVENPAFDLMMEGVSPGNDSDVSSYDFFGFGYPDYIQFNNTFDLNSLMSSPSDQMMSCETLNATTNIDA
ncbi:10569_t:CDS:2 [Rhizophagus irregularis]|nr:10569_t:CDS:2 [Rhizophagus irregularis]